MLDEAHQVLTWFVSIIDFVKGVLGWVRSPREESATRNRSSHNETEVEITRAVETGKLGFRLYIKRVSIDEEWPLCSELSLGNRKPYRTDLSSIADQRTTELLERQFPDKSLGNLDKSDQGELPFPILNDDKHHE